MMDGSDSARLQLLKGVSRSFYLSLRLLPSPMRGSAVLAYLMARASDTVADTASVDEEVRIRILREIEQDIRSESAVSSDFSEFVGSGASEAEQQLLGHLAAVWSDCRRRPDDELSLIKEVIATIFSGQRLDLERFTKASGGAIVSLSSDQELEDYTYRVAGCVGEFWTKQFANHADRVLGS